MPGIFDITEYPKSDFKKVQYFKGSVGNRIVRVILKDHFKSFAHFYKRVYVECLGKDECPICQENVKIRAQFGKDAKDHGYLTTIQRFAVNVLERTPAIVCDHCQTEVFAGMNGKFPAACTSCGNMLVGKKPSPLNKVKLLTGGVELFGMLNGYNESQLDLEGNPLGLENFDINLMGMMQSDGKLKITPFPLPNQNDDVIVPDEELFDTNASLLRLSASEILELGRGVAIKDIFASRRTSPSEDKEEGEEIDEDTKSVAEEAVKGVFNL